MTLEVETDNTTTTHGESLESSTTAKLNDSLDGSGSAQHPAAKARPKGGSIPLPLLILGGLVVVVILIMIVRTAVRSPQGDQSASTQKPAAAAEDKSFIAFGSVQNDPEGYDGFQWGISVDEFEKLAKERNKSLREETFDSGDFLLNSSIAVWFIEQVPDSGFGHGGGYDPKDKYYPETVPRTDMTNMAIYQFYNYMMALVAVPLDSDPTNSLRSKYQFSNRVQFRSGVSATINGTFTIDLYKRGNTNTRVYNVTYQQDDGQTEHMLIYVPSAMLYEIAGQVNAKVRADKDEQIRRGQAAQAAHQSVESQKVQ